ncbi:MAG: hypothetical protein RI988_2972 [Pseudomonadota bacterium]|jgi:nucleotide-binding universal stress UspA family protein
MQRNVLLAYDATASGHLSLLQAVDPGSWPGARIELLAVIVPPTTLSAEPDFAGLDALSDAAQAAHARVVLDAQVERLRSQGFDAHGTLVRGTAVQAIIDGVRATKADLLVIGHARGRSWLDRWWRGCLTKALLDRAPCDVLVVMTN